MYSLQCNPVLNLRLSRFHMVAEGLSFMVYECLVVLSVDMHNVLSILTMRHYLKCSAVKKVASLFLSHLRNVVEFFSCSSKPLCRQD